MTNEESVLEEAIANLREAAQNVRASEADGWCEEMHSADLRASLASIVANVPTYALLKPFPS